MKTQISRNSFDSTKRYSGVYQQMGRMFTDADWNELSDLAKHRLADALTDVVGSGTPRGRGIVEITEQTDGTKSYALVWGYAYVDGILAQVHPDPDASLSDPSGVAFEYEHQADFPNAPPLPTSGDYTLYLDVWERTVIVLEDNQLRDAGLQGADTCTRTQTMAQVKWCETTVEPENVAQNPTMGEAKCTLVLREASTEADPCDPCADEIALQEDVGNYLFRVEVHHVEYDTAGLPERILLKWSGENGAEQYAIGGEPPGYDNAGWTFEFFDGYLDEEAAIAETFDSEKHLGKHLATGFTPTRGELFAEYPDTVPAGYTAVRRWDGYCELLKNGSNWTLQDGADRGVDLSTTSSSTAPGHVDEGSSVAINLDAITLTIDINDYPMLAGDYWLAVVRQAVNVAGDTLLDNEKPLGIRHHYMTLGSMISDVFIAYHDDQCKRFEFPPLTDIRAKDVCYSNDACDMPDVDTVQQAIDYLCRERDLRWHNKHLHGWGIVCGLIAECVFPPPPGSVEGGTGNAGDEITLERREVRVSKGYALTCEGEDVDLREAVTIDVMSAIEELTQAGTQVLTDGNGTVCLRLDLTDDGKPEINVVPYDSQDQGNQSLLDGTLLMDFYQHCIVDLLEAIVDEFHFMDANELDEVEGGSTGLVSTNRRKFTSMLNLLAQLINNTNGAYVFLSHKEHLVLRDIYLGLRALLQSKTFCAMFEGDDFPDYPFPDSGMTTYFGKNLHTRVKLHPDKKQVYTYGGSGKELGNTINVYDVSSGELTAVIKMPAAEGAEISAVTFSDDGNLLYAAAVVRQVDTMFGAARISDNYTWEQMNILCAVEITEMELSSDDPQLIYAVGRGSGLYFLRPQVLNDQSKPQPTAVYTFNAVGHMAIDNQARRAYCTQLVDNNAEPAEYDAVAVCNLNIDSGVSSQPPTLSLSLADSQGVRRAGSDGLAVRVAKSRQENSRLFVVVDSAAGSADKVLLTYDRPLNSPTQQPIAALPIENTQVSMAYHYGADRLILAMEDGYRLQLVSDSGEATNTFRVPVQLQPYDVIVDPDQGNVYTLNFLSNTISVTPASELEVSDDFLNDLYEYRVAVLNAFFSLIGGLLQYLKDCFCHHLLVKCPECNAEEDVLYLAAVEIRDNEVYNICNFEKRKYVKSFPTVSYWMSLIPIGPVLKYMVSQLCCSILPNLFDGYRDKVIRTPQFAANEQHSAANFVSANTTRESTQTYQRTDVKSLVRNQTKSVGLLGKLGVDSIKNFGQSIQPAKGVSKQALMDSSVNDASMELQKNNITVVAVKEYDAKQAGSYAANFVRTPQRIEPGSKVTLFQQNGKVAFYAVEKETPAAAIEISESAKAELAQFEARKANLENFSTVNADLAQLQSQKVQAENELTGLRAQIETVKTERVAEEQKLAQLETQRAAIASGLSELNDSVLALAEQQNQIKLEIAKSRPVKDLSEVDTNVDNALREAGIRTIEELSLAKPSQLTATKAIDDTTAKAIIKAAKQYLSK